MGEINSYNANALILKHEKSIKILEAIKYFEKMICSKVDSINGFAGTFTELRKKYYHNIDIYNMCIDRLILRYNNFNK